MEAAGRIVGRALVAVRDAARPGVSTLELDEIAETLIREAGATPSFKGYEGFPASICSSVNDVVVHGIPTADVILAEGDLVSIDCGAYLNGWHGDSAWTFGIGTLSESDTALNDATRAILDAGVAMMVPGNRLTDISHAIEQATAAESRRRGHRLGVVDGFGGHAIGTEMHMDPFLPNEGKPGRGPWLEVGSVLAIEPIISAGSVDNEVLEDDWTVVTVDGARTSHWEHTVAVTESGPRILTPRP